MADWFQSSESYLYCIVNKIVGSQPVNQIYKLPKVCGWERQIYVDIICRKLFKDDLTLSFSAFRFPHGDKSSVKGFHFATFKAHL